MIKGVKIEGYLYKDDNTELGVDEFLDAFIEFIESKGWQFGGSTGPVDDEGNDL